MARKLSQDLNNPYLFMENPTREYTYGQNDVGGKAAIGSLYLIGAPHRDAKAQVTVGEDSRRGKGHNWGADDGGHLIGARFGGEIGKENLTAQSRNLNRGSYKHMENQWAERLESGDKVFAHIETDDAQRPRVSIYLTSILQPNKKIWYYTLYVKTRKRL